MARFSVWTHPKTGEARVYVNVLPMQGSAKVWIERRAADSFGDELNVRVNSLVHNRSEAANLANEVEAALTEMAGRRIKTWADLIALVK